MNVKLWEGEHRSFDDESQYFDACFFFWRSKSLIEIYTTSTDNEWVKFKLRRNKMTHIRNKVPVHIFSISSHLLEIEE